MTTKTTTENPSEAGKLNEGDLNKVTGGLTVVDVAKLAALEAAATVTEQKLLDNGFGSLIGKQGIK